MSATNATARRDHKEQTPAPLITAGDRRRLPRGLFDRLRDCASAADGLADFLRDHPHELTVAELHRRLGRVAAAADDLRELHEYYARRYAEEDGAPDR